MAKKLSEIKPNKHNPRSIKKERQEKLAQYLEEYGALSGVVYNNNPDCEAIVSGHQRTAEFKRQKAKLTILERYEPAQSDGTTARGFLETPNGQRYTYREVMWDKEKADAATIIANGQFGEWDSDILANAWEFDMPELRDFGVPEFVFGGDGMDGEGRAEQLDYSDKNKEIDVNDFSDLMELKFKFEKDDFLDIQERLNVVCAKQNVDTKEQALKELLFFYERHGA